MCILFIFKNPEKKEKEKHNTTQNKKNNNDPGRGIFDDKYIELNCNH